MKWTTPKTFVGGEPILPTDMNEISDNLNYLFDRPKQGVTRLTSPTSVTVTGTAWTWYNPLGFGSLRYPCTQNTVYLITLNIAACSFNTANRYCYFDVGYISTGIMTGSSINYMSSGTTTPLTNGIYATSSVANENTPISFSLLWEAPSTDDYKFATACRMSGTGTCALRCDLGLPQLYVVEIASN